MGEMKMNDVHMLPKQSQSFVDNDEENVSAIVKWQTEYGFPSWLKEYRYDKHFLETMTKSVQETIYKCGEIS